MDAPAWIALAGVVGTLLLNGGGYLIAWGSLRSTVSALAQRVAATENEIGSLNDLKVSVVRLETRLDALIEHVRDLNASIRWMREPADGRPSRGAG